MFLKFLCLSILLTSISFAQDIKPIPRKIPPKGINVPEKDLQKLKEKVQVHFWIQCLLMPAKGDT